ncbi:MAG: PepSY-associated TM helix domain-containing protein, partial [Comamonas sp.]
LMFMYMPWAPKVVYEGDQRTYVAEVFPTARGAQSPKPTGTPAPLVPLAAIAQASSAAWGGAGVASLVIHNPGDASARVVASRHERGVLTSNQASITFDGVDGTLVGRNGENIAPASNTRGVLYGLHLGRFSDMGLRWLFFVSGLAGCAMVATGLLLWAVKERQKHAKALAKGGCISIGLWLVDGLNIAAVAGLPAAMGAYLWGNRLLPVAMAARPDMEIHLFFTVWGACALLALIRPTLRMWQLQLGMAAALWMSLPLLNPLTGGLGLPAAIAAGQWGIAGFDLTAWAIGMLFAACVFWLRKRKALKKPVARPHAATNTGNFAPAQPLSRKEPS